MIKKVKTSQLRPGIFIDDFNCDWNGGNIFIEKTLINDAKLIDIIHSWGIKEVYIDTSRGLDIDEDPGQKSPRHRTISPKSAAAPPHPSINPAPPQVPLEVEMKEATNLRNDAVNVVNYTVEMVEQGKTPDIGLTYELARRMRDSISRNRDALLLLTRIRKKDEYTLFHSISVASLMLDLCNFKKIREKDALDLAVGALFHDIGKTRIPHEILNKPSRLTDSEYTIMKRHVEHSVELLQGTKNLPLECFDIALHHHEKYDGTGYPNNLSGDDISRGAQMAAICDVFDAVTSNRCYREGLGTVSGLKEIYENSGSHFDADLSHEFIRCIGVYPVGSCIKLENGKVGIVNSSTENLLRPQVRLFYDDIAKERFSPITLDLTKSDLEIVSYEEPGKLGVSASNLLSQVIV